MIRGNLTPSQLWVAGLLLRQVEVQSRKAIREEYGMKSIIGALLLVPAMPAVALAQVPTADAKEGRVYVEGGIGFGVSSMVLDFGSSKGFNAEPLFTAGFAGEYGITEQIGVLAKFGIGKVLHDDPDVLSIGMTFDG